MKSSQKCFAIIPLVIVFTLLVIGGGAYFVMHQNATPQTQKIDSVKAPISRTTQTSSLQSVLVFGMSEYTNSDFRFSFWYPKNWTRCKTNPN